MSANSARVAIIGSGFSGIAAAYWLKKRGIKDLTIFEKSSGIGGTWFDNRYPGAEVDTPSHIYSFSFSRGDWSRTHVAQKEILAYLERTAADIGLGPHFKLNTEVGSLEWSDAEAVWTVHLKDGTSETFDFVISAVGFLNIPNMPQWAVDNPFKGTIVHSARWPKGLDLTGKRVGVVGTGSTAVQVVTELSKIASELTVFQREPNWVFPKGNRPFSTEERKHLKGWIPHKLRRFRHFLKYEFSAVSQAQTVGSARNLKLREQAMAYLNKELEGRDDLKKVLTPDYPVWGKRLVFCDTWYSTLRRDNVRVAPQVQRLEATGAITTDGETTPLDAIVLATGFQATNYLGGLRVKGRQGVDLHEKWNGEPAALLGIGVPQFPNFFMMYGPSSNGVPLIFVLESQADYIAKSIRDVARSGKRTVEATEAATASYDAWVQKRLKNSVAAKTNNYFKTASGKIVTQWPYTGTAYRVMTKILRRLGNVYGDAKRN